MPGRARRPVLLYDADCRLCRFAARIVVRLDRGEELAVLPLRDERAAPFLEPLPEDERFASWRLALTDGTLAGYGAGSVALLQAMRLTRPAASVLATLPGRVLEVPYGVVAGHRSLLGRIVPDGPAPLRFP
jgi:predicted DCC family thiol-disulfide oxidoreductase YuxK